jgi:hypothetical protein
MVTPAAADWGSESLRYPQPIVVLQELLTAGTWPDKLTVADFGLIAGAIDQFRWYLPPEAARQLKSCQPEQAGRSVRLAAQVVPWHTFYLVGFGAFDLQPRHPQNQGRRR